MFRMCFFVATLTLVTAAPVLAQSPDGTPPDTAQQQESAPNSESPVASSGIRVYIDPATGQRTSHPTPEQRRAAAAEAALNRELDGFERATFETRPNGEVIGHLNGGNRSVVMAKPGRNGKIRVECTDPMHGHPLSDASSDSSTASDER
jgi:hypothetical protein